MGNDVRWLAVLVFIVGGFLAYKTLTEIDPRAKGASLKVYYENENYDRVYRALCMKEAIPNDKCDEKAAEKVVEHDIDFALSRYESEVEHKLSARTKEEILKTSATDGSP